MGGRGEEKGRNECIHANAAHVRVDALCPRGRWGASARGRRGAREGGREGGSASARTCSRPRRRMDASARTRMLPCRRKCFISR
jgi:hypothetical protein